MEPAKPLSLVEDKAKFEILHGANEDSAQMPAASFFARFGASVLDGILYTAFFAIAYAPLNKLVQSAAESNDGLTEAMGAILYLICTAASILIYFAWPLADRGQTLGKRVFKIKLIRLSDGKPLPARKAFSREIVYKLLSSIFFIGFLMAAVRKDKRALHDLLAGTRVVKSSE